MVAERVFAKALHPHSLPMPYGTGITNVSVASHRFFHKNLCSYNSKKVLNNTANQLSFVDKEHRK